MGKLWLVGIPIIILAASCSPAAQPPTSSPFPAHPSSTETPNPTIPLTLTETPTSEPTITLTSTYETAQRTPVEQIPYSLDCKPAGTLIHCHDTLLKMSFDYAPGMWKVIQPKLEWGYGAGYVYGYFPKDHPDWPIAAGISRDYSAGREGTDFDFGAGNTSEETVGEQCEGYDVCFEVKPGVVMIVSPPIGQFCQIGKTVINWPPYILVHIQLPENKVINGFVFSKYFTTEQATTKLNELVGLAAGDIFPHCTDTTIPTYKAVMADLVAGKNSGFMDNTSLDNFRNILLLAESIEFDK